VEDYSDLQNDPDYSDLSLEPSSEGFLQNSLNKVFGKTSPMERIKTATISGIPSAVAGVTPENAIEGQIDALPIEGQMVGGMTGGPWGKYLGSVAGETLGDVVRGGIKHFQGKENFSPSKIGLNTAITAATEGLGRGFDKLFMGKSAARETIKKGASSLSKMKDTLRTLGETDPNLKIPKKPILDLLETESGRSLNPQGPAKTIFKQWIKKLSDPKITHLTPDALMQMEQQFGQIANFQTKGGFLEKLLYKLQSGVKDPILEGGAKTVRSGVSSEVNTLAKKAGIEGFEDTSKKFSSAKYEVADTRNWLEKALGSTIKFGEVPLMATTARTFGLPASLGAGIGIVDLIRRNPVIQDILYKTIGKTGIGRGATLGISELMRNAPQSN